MVDKGQAQKKTRFGRQEARSAPRPRELGNLELFILSAVLRCEEDAYGYSIQQELLKQLNREYSLGAIYTTLERMERKGYVSSRLSDVAASERGGRPKRLFKVEGAGIKAIHDTQSSHAQMWWKGDEGIELI